MKALTLLALILFSLNLQAQTASIGGTITAGKKRISDAHIYVLTIKSGTITDEEGNYFMKEIPSGKIVLTISALGYKTITREVFIASDDHQILNFNLNELSNELEEVILVDHHTGITRQSPYNISSINLKGIENKGNPLGVMGILKEVPGVYGAEFGHGIIKPFIRGLGFSRIVTIYQGNKLENHQWGADHGLGINDLGVKRAEVIKGPASVLYGSGALGGVLVLKDDDHYLHSTKLTGNFGSTYNHVSRGIRTYASIGKSWENKVFLAADAAYENHADYVNGNNRIIGNSRFNSSTLRLHTGIENDKFKNKLSFTSNRQNLGIIIDEEMENEYGLATTRNDRDMQLPYQEVTDHLFSYDQTTFHGKFETFLHLSHHINLRKEIEEQHGQTDLGLEQNHTFYNAGFRFHDGKMRHNFGVQGSIIQTRNMPNAQDFLLPDAKVYENALYYLASLEQGPLFFQGAIRYDFRSITADAGSQSLIDANFILPGDPENQKLTRKFDGFTGSLGVTGNINDKNTLKLNISTGFRAPDLAELFSNGPHPGTSRFEMGNDDFGREKSLQADLSYTYRNKRFRGTASAFASKLENFIFFASTGERRPQDDLEIWKFQQTNAGFQGAEFEVSHTWLDQNQLETKFSGAIVRGKDLEAERHLNFIPPDNYSAELGYYALKDRSLYLFTRARIVDSQNRVGDKEEPTSGYTLLNAGISKKFNCSNYNLNTGLTINNVLNRNYVDHMSILRPFQVASPGRNFMINLQVNF